MQAYMLKRLLLFVPTLILASMMIFGIMRVLPGDVALAILITGEGESQDIITEEDIQRIRDQLGLGDPLVVQYVKWVRGLVTGDLGTSLFNNREVSTMISERLPITLHLMVYTVTLSLVVSIPLGVIAALKQNKWPDYLIRLTSILGLAAPNFWIGMMIILFLVLVFRWVPDPIYEDVWVNPITNISILIWPVLVLNWRFSSYQARVMRANLLEVLRMDYVRTAHSKGLSPRMVVTRHAVRNALLPVITLLGSEVAVLLGGTVILENVFNLSGIGQALIQGMQQRDYPIVQALAMMFMTFTLVANLIVDILYAVLNPRIRYG